MAGFLKGLFAVGETVFALKDDVVENKVPETEQWELATVVEAEKKQFKVFSFVSLVTDLHSGMCGSLSRSSLLAVKRLAPELQSKLRQCFFFTMAVGLEDA